MIQALAVILLCQLTGETISRIAALPVPGPVLGMILLWAALSLSPRLAALVAPTAEGILRHLALLFVPAGVGVVGHLGSLGTQALGLAVAILVSTVAAILGGAAVFVLVARLTGARDD